MSEINLLTLEQRKHDLRQDLTHTAKTYGKAARETAKIMRMIQKVQRTEGYLLRRG